MLGEGEDARGWALAVVLEGQNVPLSRTFQKMKSEYLHVLAHGEDGMARREQRTDGHRGGRMLLPAWVQAGKASPKDAASVGSSVR